MAQTALERRSASSRRSWRSRKRRAKACGFAPDHSHVETVAKPPTLAARVLAETTPERSSAIVASLIGCTSGYVRTVWKRSGLDQRTVGKWPAENAREVTETKSSRIIELLATTDKTRKQIAEEVGCLEAYVRVVEQRIADPDRCSKRDREYRRRRYHVDPVYRARELARKRPKETRPA